MKSIVMRLHNSSAAVHGFLHAVIAIVLFLIGAALENRIQLIWSEQANDKIRGWAWILGLVLIAIAYAGFRYAFARIVETEGELGALHQKSIQNAREQLVLLHLDQLTHCDRLIERKEKVTEDLFRSALVCDQSRLESLVRIVWENVNSHHNISAVETERLNFEVTLITKSKKDDYLTIAAWRNRQMTRPKSLVIREQSDPVIYEKTAAAKMMKDGNVETLVIEDTSEPTANYEQLYTDQKTRIRSSVLHPISSPSRKQLGTLVLHCERPKFFRNDDRRYWQEFLSIFAPAIALELERIDGYNRMVKDWSQPVHLTIYSPF